MHLINTTTTTFLLTFFHHLRVAYTFCVIIIIFPWYFTTQLWFTSLTHLLNLEQYPQGVNYVLQGRLYFRFLRCQQVISRVLFDISATALLAIHHLTLLVAHILANVFMLSTSNAVTTEVMVMRLGCVGFVPLGYALTYSEISLLATFSRTVDKFYDGCDDF